MDMLHKSVKHRFPFIEVYIRLNLKIQFLGKIAHEIVKINFQLSRQKKTKISRIHF